MQNLSEIVKIKEAAEADLLNRPGVTGVDVGYKYVGGQKTDEIAIRVHVVEKKDVAATEQIPEVIAGIKTDVLQNTFVLQVLKIPVTEVTPVGDSNHYDPLVGGISFGPCRVIHGNITVAGTLGAIVGDKVSGTPALLSNSHLMAPDSGSQVGDTMTQPSLGDFGLCPNDIVGTLQRTSLGGEVDCAIAELTARDQICEIADIGLVKGVADVALLALDTPLRKRGSTTGLTFGTLDGIAMTVTIDYGEDLGNVTLTNQFNVKVDSGQSERFSALGDSGSVVVDGENKVVGLLSAATPDGQIGIANTIQAVLQALNITICSLIIRGDTSVIIAQRTKNDCDPFGDTGLRRHFTSNANPAAHPHWSVDPPEAARVDTPDSVETDIVFTGQPGVSGTIWKITLVEDHQIAEVDIEYKQVGPCP